MTPTNFPFTDRLLDLAVAIQQIPAPTFQEAQRAAFVRACFEKEALFDVATDRAGNVYARLPGRCRGRPLVVSAHLDTVFPLGTDLSAQREPDRICAPGIGDNSLAVAALLGLAWALRRSAISLPGDIWLVANVCEEGLGDLRGMRAVVERFGGLPQGYIVLEGMALGQVYTHGLGVRRYRITARTAGGHSWVDYGLPSAVHELAALVTRLAALPVPAQPRCSLNVGIIAGGTSVNTIAAEAHLELDLRSEDAAALNQLAGQVNTLVNAAQRPGVGFEIEIIGERPSGGIPHDHWLVRLAQSALQAQGVTPVLNCGSTDANIPLSRGLPAICIGLTSGGGAHTVNEYILTRPVELGLGQLMHLVEGCFQASSGRQ